MSEAAEARRTGQRSDGLAAERAEVLRGLQQQPKTASSKYFYDERGSELFESITRLPEYYLTRTERALLHRHAESLVAELRPASLVELGAGSASKTRVLLDAMTRDGRAASYVPLDVSADFLHETAGRLRSEYPTLAVQPAVADLTRPFDLPPGVPGPTLFAFLGSTIGNFAAPQATRLLGRGRGLMPGGDALLLGADLRPGDGKSRAELEAAYNDGAGVTAAFNLNLLEVLNARVGTDFDPSRFRHRAHYDQDAGRIEMHLVSLGDQTVRVPGGPTVRFADGEALRTEISCKYDRTVVEELFGIAGLKVERWLSDDRGRYALVLGRPTRD